MLSPEGGKAGLSSYGLGWDLLPMLWTLGWTPSAWNVVPGETASSKIMFSALTHDQFLCAFRTGFFFFMERAQNYIAADVGSVLAQVPP